MQIVEGFCNFFPISENFRVSEGKSQPGNMKIIRISEGFEDSNYKIRIIEVLLKKKDNSVRN